MAPAAVSASDLPPDGCVYAPASSLSPSTTSIHAVIHVQVSAQTLADEFENNHELRAHHRATRIFKRSSRALESSASQPSSSPSPRLQSKPQAPSPKPIEMPLMRKSASSWQLQAMYEREVEMEPSLARKQAPPKPPRHASEPQCARVLRALWQRELRRPDVGLTADFFDDLGGSDEQALALVREMQLLGFHISAPQFFALPRSSVYTVLLVAL